MTTKRMKMINSITTSQAATFVKVPILDRVCRCFRFALFHLDYAAILAVVVEKGLCKRFAAIAPVLIKDALEPYYFTYKSNHF